MVEAKKVGHVPFIHGAGAGAHAADSKLAASLETELGAGWDVVCPKMPEERPNYQLWKSEIARACGRSTRRVFVVGHSFGGSLLLKYLSEEPTLPAIGGIFIIAAPYWGPGGWSGDEFALREDVASKLPEQSPVFLYHGRDDGVVPFEHLALYRRKLPQARVRELVGRDHQLNDDLSETARDILDLIADDRSS